MAITSFPFDNQDTDESQFSLLFKELQDSGVADTHNGDGFRVVVGTGMSVSIRPGLALLRGFAVSSNALENRTLSASPSGTVIHRVILRLDTVANAITLTTLTGTPGGAAPVLTQTQSGTFEIPLAVVTIPSGTNNITEGMVVDDRDFLGQRVGAWTTAKRPGSPRAGRTGYNVDLHYLEVFTGLQWTPVAPQEPVGTVTLDVGGDVPADRLVCDGTEHLISTYPALFNRIGQRFKTNPALAADRFQVPDLRGRVVVGFNAGDADFAAVGTRGGDKSVTLTEGQMPHHAHGVNDPGHSHSIRRTADESGGYGIGTALGGFRDRLLMAGGAGSGGPTGHGGTGIGIYGAGGNQAHPNLQPYLALRYLVKAV